MKSVLLMVAIVAMLPQTAQLWAQARLQLT